MSNKKTISEIELLNILNNKLEKHPEYKNCQFEDIQRIIPNSASHCNWSGAGIRYSRRPVVGYSSIVFRIVAETQAKYILK